MSDYSSFITEYIECDKCKEAASDYFINTSDKIHDTFTESLDIVDNVLAGSVCTPYYQEEFNNFEDHILPGLMNVLCHPLRITLLGSGNMTKLYCVEPARKLIKEQILITEKTSESVNARLDRMDKYIEDKLKRISTLEDKIQNLEDRIEGKVNQDLGDFLNKG